ncbi:hypothetical protein [Enterobacter roggenkampii]|uniref:hypothetical protein n=1 Tax=Enterobacter roggenkampii TaxID=1812935 RepID=UPI001F613ACF|nr:hypothetical protein [Enterobacter roggenkampii]
MSQGVRTCIASLELKPGKMLARLTRQTICTSSPKREEIIMTNEWFSDRLWVFKLTGTAKADRLLEIFAYARRRYGIELFVIDNLAKCGLDEEDYTGQKTSSTPFATSRTNITVTSCWLPMPEKQTTPLRPERWT